MRVRGTTAIWVIVPMVLLTQAPLTTAADAPSAPAEGTHAPGAAVSFDEEAVQSFLLDFWNRPETQEFIKTCKIAVSVICAGLIVIVAGYIWFVVNGFRASIGWGLAWLLTPVVSLAALFFVPVWWVGWLVPLFVTLVFVLARWRLARGPFLVQVLGALIAAGGGTSVFVAARKTGEEMAKGASQMVPVRQEYRTLLNTASSSFKLPPSEMTLEEMVPENGTTGKSVKLGDSEEKVKEVLGTAGGRLQDGPRVYLLYPNVVEIWLIRDQVVVIRPPGVWGGPSD